MSTSGDMRIDNDDGAPLEGRHTHPEETLLRVNLLICCDFLLCKRTVHFIAQETSGSIAPLGEQSG